MDSTGTKKTQKILVARRPNSADLFRIRPEKGRSEHAKELYCFFGSWQPGPISQTRIGLLYLPMKGLFLILNVGGKVVLSLVVVKKQQLPVFFWEVWKGIGCKNISQFLLVKTFPLSFHPGFPNLLTNGPQFLPGEINSSTKSFSLGESKQNPHRVEFCSWSNMLKTGAYYGCNKKTKHPWRNSTF